MMRNTIVGKVDDTTAMISTEVFNPELVGEFMTSDEFKNMEKELGLSHEVFQLTKNQINIFKIYYQTYTISIKKTLISI